MATAKELRARISLLRNNLTSIVGQAMLENKEEIVSLLVHQQYEEGLDSEGQPLRQYSRHYAREKNMLTGRGYKTDLNLTGQTQAELNLSVDESAGTYRFGSPTVTETGENKIQWLNRWNRNKGGADVDKLTADKKPEVWRIIAPIVLIKAKETMRLR